MGPHSNEFGEEKVVLKARQICKEKKGRRVGNKERAQLGQWEGCGQRLPQHKAKKKEMVRLYQGVEVERGGRLSTKKKKERQNERPRGKRVQAKR